MPATLIIAPGERGSIDIPAASSHHWISSQVTEPLGPNDPKPSVYMPKDFLVRLDPKDLPPPPSKKKK